MSRHRILWQPERGWVGDVIPFAHDGWLWLYYLHDWRGLDGRPAATSWHLVRTQDLVRYEDIGAVLPHGPADAQDRNCYTGSVIEADGQFHLFATGYNPAFVDPDDGLPTQVVMHAVSDDLVHWVKRPQDTFGALQGFETHDWRDPFVMRDPDADRWLMYLAARSSRGLPRRRGATAVCASTDLITWQAAPPHWEPGLFMTHECPEVFREGDWWYLTFSEFSERFGTRYRRSRHARGPWEAPPRDTLDGRAWYAPRTAVLDGVRYAFGWIATRDGDTDDGAWQWAGTLAVHELTACPDGTLGVSLPSTIRASFTRDSPVEAQPVVGAWRTDGVGTSGTCPSGFGLVRMGRLPTSCLVTLDVTFAPGTRACGVALRLDYADPDTAYYVRLEPERSRMVFDRWPRRRTGDHQWQVSGDVSHAVELEREVDLASGLPHRLDLLVDGSALIAYLDGSVAMSARMLDRPSGGWGCFVSEGSAAFSGLSVRTRDPNGGSAAEGGP